MSERKLAVILHADVVGSTTLVQLDETLAHDRIQDAFRRLSAAIVSHGGATLEVRGDAVVAEFARASDAVSAALDFQAANTAHNATLHDEIRPATRIGIAMGEVVVADNTVTGAGVVMAQRLEQLAEAGSVCIQGAVRDTVPKRLPFDYENLGEREVKGFDEAVRAYAVSLRPGSEAPRPQSQKNRAPAPVPPRDKPSIAVLPFTNMSGDREQEYFSDGITEDIITDLSRFRTIQVAARNSSFSCKGSSSMVQDIASKLGVDYVLEGSVRRAGDRVRVNAQLIYGENGTHVWAERYDRNFDDIFEIQDELTRTIVTTISRRIELDSLERSYRKPTHSMDAYDYVLRGRERLDRRDRESATEAKRLFEKAVDLDPAYATAWSELAGVYMWEWNGAWAASPEKSLRRGVELAEKAFSLDPNDPRILQRFGFNLFMAGDLERALQLFKRALELNPYDSEALCRRGLALSFMGKHQEGIGELERALELDPFGTSIAEWYLGIAYFSDRQYEKAIETLKSCRAGLAEIKAWLAAAYGQAGRKEDALKHGESYLREARAEMEANDAAIPDSWCEFLAARGPFKQSGDMEHFMEGLRKAGVR